MENSYNSLWVNNVDRVKEISESMNLLCKVGLHKFSWGEWETDWEKEDRDVAFFCPRCQKRIRVIPFDKCPEQWKKQFSLPIVKLTKTSNEGKKIQA